GSEKCPSRVSVRRNKGPAAVWCLSIPMTTHGGKKLIKAPRAAAVITTSALGRWKYALRARTAKAVTQRRKRRAPPTRKAASGIIVESSSRLITVPVGLPRSSCAVGRTREVDVLGALAALVAMQRGVARPVTSNAWFGPRQPPAQYVNFRVPWPAARP